MGFNMHVKDFRQKDLNYIFLFLLFICFSGTIFLTWKDVTPGRIYFTMFIGTAAMIGLLFLWFKDDNKLKPITNYVRIPIATHMPLAAFLFLLGRIVPFVIQLFLGLFKSSYNVSSFSVPLSAGSLEIGLQSFSTAEIGASMPWKIFLYEYVAGTVETFTYNFGLVLYGIFIGYMILYLIKDKVTITPLSKFFVLTCGFGVTAIYFVISHMFNATYGLVEYAVAFGFLMVANISIYLAGVFLLFWAGYHMSNNLIYLIVGNGFLPVANGYVSWFGLIEIGFTLLLIFYVIRKWSEVVKGFRKWFS